MKRALATGMCYRDGTPISSSPQPSYGSLKRSRSFADLSCLDKSGRSCSDSKSRKWSPQAGRGDRPRITRDRTGSGTASPISYPRFLSLQKANTFAGFEVVDDGEAESTTSGVSSQTTPWRLTEDDCEDGFSLGLDLGFLLEGSRNDENEDDCLSSSTSQCSSSGETSTESTLSDDDCSFMTERERPWQDVSSLCDQLRDTTVLSCRRRCE